MNTARYFLVALVLGSAAIADTVSGQGPDLTVISAALRDLGVNGSDTNLAVRLEEAYLQAVDPRAVLGASPYHPPTNTAVNAAEVLPSGIQYIRLNGVFPGAAETVADIIQARTNTLGPGMILDLREAGGARHADVDSLAGIFLGSRMPLYRLLDRSGNVFSLHEALPPSSSPAGERPPLILLTDNHTSDASELLAACLRGKSGVMLIGSPTRGDNAVRDSITLQDGRHLYIAMQFIDMVEGPGFAGTGVLPDIRVNASETRESNWTPPEEDSKGRPVSERTREYRLLQERVKDDHVLARAADILLGLQALHLNGTALSTNAAAGESGEPRQPKKPDSGE